MLNTIFKDKFNFTYNYFSALLDLINTNERNFPQSLIFEGSDTIGQYLFSLELARILNCKGDKSQNCDCINCRWIRDFSHPSINIVSQIHFKGENDETKTVISVAQAKRIEQALALTSEYHRFFIFFSSKNRTYSDIEKDTFFKDFKSLGYKDKIDYEINPLNFSTFNIMTPNALLKSIEEPPKNTTFIFLTKSKEEILSTIVSRCLVFKLSGNNTVTIKNSNEMNNIFSHYPDINFQNCFEISDNILSFIKENESTLEVVLNSFIDYLLNLIKSNLDNTMFYQKVQNDIDFINQAIKETRTLLSDKIVIENLMLKIIRGH